MQRYGMLQWGDLFTARQKLALVTLGRTIQTASCSAGVKDLLGLVLDRVSSRSSSLCLWRYHADQEKVEHVFGRQALPVVWDFAEAVTMSQSTGSFQDGVEVVAQCVQSATAGLNVVGQAQQADAYASPLPDETASVWFTDPLITMQCHTQTYQISFLSGSNAPCHSLCSSKILLIQRIH